MIETIKDILFYFIFVIGTAFGIALIFLIIKSILETYFEHIRECQQRKYPISEINHVLKYIRNMTEDLTTERSRKSKKIVDVLDYLIEEYRIKALASAELDKVIANEKKIIREHIRNTYIKIKEKSKILYNKIKNEININKKVF